MRRFLPRHPIALHHGRRRAFRAALDKHDIVLAEVGIWKNVLSKNPDEAKAALQYSIRRLQTAGELNAHCAVNIVGSWCETHWDGPHEKHYVQDFFDAAVEAARKVIDAVKPEKTKMTFEIMPCFFIDGAREYLRFIRAIDRRATGLCRFT
jgi:sugar phosphate isomerase/epimerase